MSSKRDDDSSADMEVGMTTAERRRRRRRGGGLRVPSDNVPRRSSTPPVVAPVPEDPSLAMSIAYSFTSEASEPVPRVTIETPVPTFEGHEAMPTVIDTVSSPVEQADFEMKTREMSAVDLEALGLQEPSTSGRATREVGMPGLEPVTTTAPASQSVEVRFNLPRTRTDEDVEVMIDGGTTLDTDTESPAVEADGEATTIAPLPAQRLPVTETSQPMGPQDSGPHRTVDAGWSGPHKTIDSGWRLPAVETSAPREPIGVPARAASDSRPPPLSIPSPPPPPSQLPAATPAPYKPGRAQTVALSEEDLEEVREAARLATNPPPMPSAAPPAPGVRPSTTSNPPPMPKPEGQQARAKSPDEPMSVPEIDIMALDEKAAETSGEFEVDVDGIVDAKVTEIPIPIAPPPSPTQPGVGDRRSRPASQPPPTGPSVRESQQLPITRESPAPPPPPVAHKAPPAPPPAKKDKPPPPVLAQKDGKAQKGKPWFVDLFDEDYLRTLPFLTPQATQAEAEFVIDAMGLTPGAQVLDIGCGYGRHAMELAARGMHVVGLDLSTPLLVRGGEEAHRRNLTINFVRGDMRELDFESQFDGAYCLFSTYGYFDDETNKKTVANIARALKPGGRMIIEILNRDYVIADLPTRVWWEGDGCVVLEEVELNYFSSRIQVNRSVVFDDGRQLEQEISVRAYSLHEVGKLMHAAGFRVLEVSGGYHTRGRFFGNQSRHIIVLAERKDATPA